jgi:pyrroline-5-carboxylate reductase
MTALHSLKIALVGGGNMARGLIGGLLRAGLPATNITVSEPDAVGRGQLEQQFGVVVTADNHLAVRNADVVVLAVKPQVMAAVTRDLAASLPARTLVVSVAAGIPCAALANWLGEQIAIVRAMPNRPALVGAGATGLYAGNTVSAAQRHLAEQVLSGTGLVVWVQRESDIDVVTALSGSGPAYFFRLAELMAAAAETQGLDGKVARALAAQTLAGAGQLVAAESQADLARMRAEVTSKGGTTEAALNEFAARGLEDAVAGAMRAAAQRSQELAELFAVKQ